MIYDVDYFIRKFKAIPEERWMTDVLGRNGIHCAIGHCIGNCSGSEPFYDKFESSEEAVCLVNVLSRLKIKRAKNVQGNYNTSVVIINDGSGKEYQQPTPKQRILAALYDTKKMLSKGQDVQECDATKADSSNAAGTKIIHHYVSVPETITEQTKELILS